MSKLLRDQRKKEAGKIAGRAYDLLRSLTGKDMRTPLFPAVRRRVLEILDVYENHHMVAVLIEEIALRDGESFGPKSLSLVRLGEIVQKSNMPDDAWEYERWWRTLPEGETRDEAERLLAIWRDAAAAYIFHEEQEARRALVAMREHNEIPEELITK